MAAKVLVRAPDVTGAAGHGNAPAKGVAGGVKKGPFKSSGDYGTPVTITCDQKKGYALSIKKSSVVLTPTNSSDPSQKWDMDDSWGDGFAIVNTNTNQAIQRPLEGAGHRLLLVPYDPVNRDDTVMWKQDNKSSPIREHDATTLVFDITRRGDDTVVIVAKESIDATSQKWTLENK